MGAKLGEGMGAKFVKEMELSYLKDLSCLRELSQAR